MTALAAASAAALPTFRAADVARLLAGLARVHATPSYAWLSELLRTLLARLDDEPRPLPVIAAAVVALPRLPGGAATSNLRRPLLAALEDLPAALAEASIAHLPGADGRHLAALAAGYAGLRLRPGGGWLGALEAAAASAAAAGTLQTREAAALNSALQLLRQLPELPPSHRLLSGGGVAHTAAAVTAQLGNEAARRPVTAAAL